MAEVSVVLFAPNFAHLPIMCRSFCSSRSQSNLLSLTAVSSGSNTSAFQHWSHSLNCQCIGTT